MKKILILSILVMSGLVFANDEETWVKQFSCLISRSETLDVYVDQASQYPFQNVKLHQHFWNIPEGGTEALLRNTKIVTYGDTSIMLADMGRSGYAMLHFTNNGSALTEGKLDINLFGRESISTNGLTEGYLCNRTEK